MMISIACLNDKQFSFTTQRGNSVPDDFSVHHNVITIFINLNDWITPTQLRFNMSQLIDDFGPNEITAYERPMREHKVSSFARFSLTVLCDLTDGTQNPYRCRSCHSQCRLSQP